MTKKKNKIIDIDSEFDDIKFDEVLINRSQAGYLKKDNKQFGNTMKRVAAERKTDEVYLEKLRLGCALRDNTYQALSNADPVVQSKISATLSGRQKSQEHLDKVATQNRKRAKPVVVPWGVFRSGKLAGDVYNVSNGVKNGKNHVSSHIKKKTSGYKFISIEEYIMLTGDIE